VRAVSDEERKGKASARDEDETSKEESSHDEDETSEEEESPGDEDENEASGKDDDEPADDKKADDDESEDEDEESGEGEGESDAAAKRVAEALGVGETADGEAEAETKPAEDEGAAPNRAARRAEAAQRRKKRKTGTAKSTEEEAAAEALPRDKNARAKELLKRRREQAAGGDTGPKAIQLLPGEMVDDALARGSSALGKWVRDNFGIIQWVILGALAAGGGYLFYESRAEGSAAGASSALMAGVNADRGRVIADDKRTKEEKEGDVLGVYKTPEERADAALADYKKVVAEHPGTGAAILARLGEAGDYLDKHDWPQALEAYSAVSSSSLANADADVKGRALEGLGFAKEGKGDIDGALATFKELENVDARGYKELALYHQGRLLFAKGDKDKAKELLKQAHDKLEQPTELGTLHYLQQMTDELLRRIDPSSVPAKTPSAIGGPKGGSVTQDDLEALRRRWEESMKKAKEKGEQH
jgi:tetratricopeptide (TPR) repeat protein